jgi:HlyD family secretion protein
MTRRTRLSAFLLVAATAGGSAWYLASSSTAGAATTAATAAVEAASSSSRVLVAPGLVEPERDAVQLGFESTGRVAAILVDEGDRIRAGQELARLDDRVARARLARAEAALTGARARLDLARRGPLPEEIAAARAEVAAARAAAHERLSARGRTERLASTGALTAAQADADIASSDVAAAQVDAAVARLRVLERGTRAELRRAAEAEVQAAEAEVAAAQVELDHCSLRAPGDGVVLRRLAEVGTLIAALTPAPILSVADVSKLELRAEIDEVDVARVEVGQVGWVTAQAFGDRRFPGRVVRITRELGRKTVRVDDPRARVDTRVLEVVFAFDASSEVDALPLGLRMEMHLPAAPRATASR